MPVAEVFQKFAGRRKGRPLHKGRANALQQAGVLIGKDVMDQSNIDPQDFFQKKIDTLWIEIGFGNGEHMTGQAARHPEISFIGCEPFINGVSAAAKDIKEQNLSNIRIWSDEALAFLDKFPAGCADRIFLLFSDPWPKTRQYKRRVIQPVTVDLFARLLKPGAELRLATDHDYLAEWMLLHVAANAAFEWKNYADGAWQVTPTDWIETRYQQKAAQQGRQAYFMDFVRR